MSSSETQNNTGKKLLLSIITIFILLFCLCITTYALVRETVYITDNVFQTGIIDINLNDGKPVIEEHEFLFEPGMTVKKDFFIENNSTWDVYYKIYLDNISGGLSDVLVVTIQDGDKIIANGVASNLTRADVSAAEDTLRVGQRRDLQIYFHFPEDAGNAKQDQTLTFDMSAEAVQTKNNPDRLFD